MPASTLLCAPSLVGRDLAKAYGDRVVLDGVDVVASPGLPLGLVGENGAGKSTLLRLLAGVEAADSGRVSRPTELAYLAQEPTFPAGSTVRDVLDEALRPLHDAVERLEVLAARLDEPGVADEYAAHGPPMPAQPRPRTGSASATSTRPHRSTPSRGDSVRASRWRP